MSEQTLSSADNPLRIAEIPFGSSAGLIGVTFAPGKQQGGRSGSHRRDLKADLDRIVSWGATAVVTLVEAHELEELKIRNLGQEVERRRMEWCHWPITDGTIPDAEFEASWPARSAKLRAVLASGGRVLIHCKGGLGRAGTISARLLVEAGVTADEALSKVRAVRPGAIENGQQERWIALGRPAPLPETRKMQRRNAMNWFERLMGFPETSYEATRQQLELVGDQLRSRLTNRSYGVGTLELVSLQELRQRVASPGPTGARLRFRNIIADVRALHQDDALRGALFQVASQFNLLEMTGPSVCPEQGVGCYEHDPTQGPACAIAAGAATIFRNYFAPVDGQVGQTSDKQLDGLADLGNTLAQRLDRPVSSLWTMRNGYALCSAEGLEAIAAVLSDSSDAGRDDLRTKLRIGLHSDVEVTEGRSDGRPRLVSQAFCSALPVSYAGHGRIDPALWQPFATLVLEAAYEATLLAAALNAQRGRSKVVLLTQLGGGVFGNHGNWIEAALKRALNVAGHHDLDVRLVNFHAISPSMMALERALH